MLIGLLCAKNIQIRCRLVDVRLGECGYFFEDEIHGVVHETKAGPFVFR